MVSPNSESVREAALRLPLEERIQLMESLMASVDESELKTISDEWDAEILRRIRSIDDGTAQMIDGDEVLQKLERGECP